MPTTAMMTWGGLRVDPLIKPEDARVMSVVLAAGTYAKGTILGEKRGNNEVQHIAVDATSGTFTITYAGQTTGAIPFDAAPSVVQTALEALSNINDGDVAVTGSASAYDITFQGALGDLNVAQVTCGSASLSGNTHTATPTTTTAGSAGTAGSYAAYDHNNTNGSQLPVAVLQYDVVSDGALHTIGGAGAVGGEWGQTFQSVPAYFSGVFAAEDLVGLDGNAIAAGAPFRMLRGTPASGIVVLTGP